MAGGAIEFGEFWPAGHRFLHSPSSTHLQQPGHSLKRGSLPDSPGAFREIGCGLSLAGGAPVAGLEPLIGGKLKRQAGMPRRHQIVIDLVVGIANMASQAGAHPSQRSGEIDISQRLPLIGWQLPPAIERVQAFPVSGIAMAGGTADAVGQHPGGERSVLEILGRMADEALPGPLGGTDAEQASHGQRPWFVEHLRRPGVWIVVDPDGGGKRLHIVVGPLRPTMATRCAAGGNPQTIGALLRHCTGGRAGAGQGGRPQSRQPHQNTQNSVVMARLPHGSIDPDGAGRCSRKTTPAARFTRANPTSAIPSIGQSEPDCPLQAGSGGCFWRARVGSVK